MATGGDESRKIRAADFILEEAPGGLTRCSGASYRQAASAETFLPWRCQAFPTSTPHSQVTEAACSKRECDDVYDPAGRPQSPALQIHRAGRYRDRVEQH